MRASATNHMGVGSGKSMQMLNFEEYGSIFVNCAYLT
jgi:hypothetical protein